MKKEEKCALQRGRLGVILQRKAWFSEVRTTFDRSGTKRSLLSQEYPGKEAEGSSVTSGDGLTAKAKPRAWERSCELQVEDRWPPSGCCSLDNGNEEERG